MGKWSLFFKICAGFLAVFFSILIALSIFFYQLENMVLDSWLYNQETVARRFQEDIREGKSIGPSLLGLQEAGRRFEVMTNTNPLKDKPRSDRFYHRSLSNLSFYYPVEFRKDLQGYLVVTLSGPNNLDRLETLEKGLVGMLFLAGILFLVLAFFFTRALMKPLTDLENTSNRLAAGDWNAALPYTAYNGYAAEMARAFNGMIFEERRRLLEHAREKEQLQAILSSLSSGIMVLNDKGKTDLANSSMLAISGYSGLEGRFYWEYIRDSQFAAFVDEKLHTRQPGGIELELRGRIFEITAAYLDLNRELILHFTDITLRREMEKVKREFVANVSHELKTPLTSISGFVENLLGDEKNTDRRRMLEIVYKNAQRLSRIVSDLLTLSRLEDPSGLLTFETVDLRGVVASVVMLFGDRAAEKSIALEYRPPAQPLRINGDAFFLEQLFINLLDNAVKYTDSGGVTVTLSAGEDGAVVVVSDTGPGIPESHLPRLFERFYVADKARSRKLGGTGLGLSIVKHIAGMHGGTVTVISREGSGTEFTVIFPLK